MDITDIAKLYTAHGPFVSLYLNTPVAIENAAQRLETTWRSTRKELLDAGVDELTVDALEPAVFDNPTGGNALVAVASHGQLLYSRRLSEELGREAAIFAKLPYVTPLLSWQQTRVPYVVVLADRTGAEILAYVDDGEPVVSEEVEGSHDEIRRVQPGGWSQRRYQQRAIDSWEGNAAEVVEEIDRIARSIDAKAILVGGDVHAVRLIQEHLPESAKGIVQLLEQGGGRATDGGSAFTAAEITDRMGEITLAQLQTVLDEFQEERGQGDRATDGVDATVQAIRKAQVGTLLVHDDPDDDRTLFFADDPSLVAMSRNDLDGVAEHVEEGRLADVLVRAAVGTGADVVVVPAIGTAIPNEGVGAILRYADSTPTTA
ncbi:MAG TPA: Vms1/Ankzf1 family peptidyl-tRNA hydrolase [Frankiaceae bacterium]|nr:Vms1/Ankzf1 family peptidyl-tRNA hydrolase [Frankiaceae bacterium]